MAFRKRSSKTRPNFRRSRNLAHKRRNWSQFSIDPCEPLEVPQCELQDSLCCTELAKFVLLSNQELQDLYSDRCTVVRLLGDLWFVPVMGTIGSPADVRAWVSYLGDRQSFLGIRKGEISSIDATASFDVFDTTNHDDLSEGRWRKTWQFHDSAFSRFEVTDSTSLTSTFELSIPVAQPNVHTYIVPGTGSCNPFTSGTGDFCIETINEPPQCFPCDQSFQNGQINFNGARIGAPRPWHVHIDLRKRWPMRENEELYFMYNNRSYSPQLAPVSGDSLTRIYGNVRVLTEMG